MGQGKVAAYLDLPEPSLMGTHPSPSPYSLFRVAPMPLVLRVPGLAKSSPLSLHHDGKDSGWTAASSAGATGDEARLSLGLQMLVEMLVDTRAIKKNESNGQRAVDGEKPSYSVPHPSPHSSCV